MPSIAFNLTFHAEVKKEGRWYIAGSPELDVYSQGLSERKALENLTEALRVFVESCFERGVLEKVFKKAGYVVRRGQVHTPQSKNHIVEVPFSLVARNAAENRAC